MNRRGFFGKLAVIPTLAVPATFAAAATPPVRKYGCIDVDGHRAHKSVTGETLHVWFDGKDITKSCIEADDVQGYALIYCRDQAEHQNWSSQGHLHVASHGGACTMRLVGDVRIAPGD